jgi:hypothetical protein
MLRAICNQCKHPILIDRETGNKFDAVDIGHRHKSLPPSTTAFVAGQYSNDQLAEMKRQEARKKQLESGDHLGYCEQCDKIFPTFHDAFLHCLEVYNHEVRAIKREDAKP